MQIDGAVTTANPNYNVNELSHQLGASKAKVIVCHESNLKIALGAAGKVGISKKNIFVFGNTAIDGVLPFETALYRERKIVPKILSYEEAKDKVAYLCFSSGTTGKSKGVMTT
jgi:long-subunit acyl-CoA synthetase (AMP-forming)